MRVTNIRFEDFTNYKKPAMFIGTIHCSGKCRDCQNEALMSARVEEVSDTKICRWYLENKITSAIVFGGLEPFDQFDEIYNFVYRLRKVYNCYDDVVIYTGFTPEEIEPMVDKITDLGNIVIKFGRFLPNQPHHRDEVLGVDLASPNQFAIRYD